MNTHFNNTPPANASAATLVEVVTDGPAYPSFNPTVTKARASGRTIAAPSSSRIARPGSAGGSTPTIGTGSVATWSWNGPTRACGRPVPPGPSIPWTPPTPPSPSTPPRAWGWCKALGAAFPEGTVLRHQLDAVHSGGRATRQGSQDLGSCSEGRGAGLDPAVVSVSRSAARRSIRFSQEV